jgi:ribonuclease Z
MKTEIFSKGLYSTYLYVKEVNSCFDCGEGMTTYLGPRCFGIRKLFISHGHHDHISGVSSLIGARCVTRGDTNAPLDIYYPDQCPELEELKNYIYKTRKPTFPLNWIPIKENTEINLEAPNRKVKSFRVDHTNNSLGFSILEKRKKVKKEYQNLNPKEFQKLHSTGVKVSEAYWANLWSYSGDASNLNPKEVENAEWFFCDCTFLNQEDRKERTHLTLKEALDIAKKANVKRFVGIHISPRYTNKERKLYQIEAQREFEKTILLPFHKPMMLDTHYEMATKSKENSTIVL